MEIKIFNVYIYISKYRMKRRGRLDDLRRNQRKKLNWMKKRIYRKTGGKCSCCGAIFSIDALRIHHVIPAAENPKLIAEKNNIKLMCEKCHIKLHKNVEIK